MNICRILRVEIYTAVFVTNELLRFVAVVAGNGVLVAARRAVPFLRAPAGLHGLAIRFRLACRPEYRLHRLRNNNFLFCFHFGTLSLDFIAIFDKKTRNDCYCSCI